ncbi:MAG: alpha/beta fold hydrolase [Gemmatimonadaceae bacterium]
MTPQSILHAGHPAWIDSERWPFRPRYAHTRDGKLHYVDEGSGPPIVLVHGTPTWSFEWRHVIAALRGSNRVIALDHLGFGLSERPANAGYSPEAHARRFAEFIDRLKIDEPITLVVHDFGGPIALDWAVTNPERIRRLVVVNSWMWSFAGDRRMTLRAQLLHGAFGRWIYRRLNASLRLLMPKVFANRRALTPAIHAQYLAPFDDEDARERVLWALARSLLDSAAFFDSLWKRRARIADVPLSLFWGMKDTAFGPDILARWAHAFPSAQVTRFSVAGHWPHEEKASDFVAALRKVV